MTLKQYIAQLTEFAEANPEALTLTVGYCVDDEGNGYDSVKFAPSIISTDDVESYLFRDGLSGRVVIIN